MYIIVLPQRGSSLNLKQLGFVFLLTCICNVIGPFLVANNKTTRATAFARSLSYHNHSMNTKVQHRKNSSKALRKMSLQIKRHNRNHLQ